MWNAINETLKAGVLVFVFMLVVVLAVLRLTRHNQVLRNRIRFPLLLLFLLLTFYDVFYSLGKAVPKMMESYYAAALYLVIAVLSIRLAILLLFSFLSRRKHYRAPKLLEEISKVLLYSVATVVILQYTLHIQVGTVLATSAIITVVLGLALQETLGNLFAGLALHLDPAYSVGDWIKAGDNSGRVEEITWRATKLRTTNNDYIIIPNGGIAKEKLINYSFPRTPHAVSVFVSIAYHVPPNKVSSVVSEALKEVNNIAEAPPPDVRVSAYQDSSINYQIKFFIKDYGLVDPTIALAKKAFWYHFRRNGVDMPFPIRDVYMHGKEERDEAHARQIGKLSESVRSVYLFASLDDDERKLIAENLDEVHYAIDEVVIHEGDDGDSFFIISEGEVEVFITTANGTRRVLNRLQEGDFFGEIALLSGGKRTASVQAATDLRVHVLRKDRFREVLERKPEILDEISNVLSKRKDQILLLMSEASGGHGETLTMSTDQAKSRIVSRIRNYFGL